MPGPGRAVRWPTRTPRRLSVHLEALPRASPVFLTTSHFPIVRDVFLLADGHQLV